MDSVVRGYALLGSGARLPSEAGARVLHRYPRFTLVRVSGDPELLPPDTVWLDDDRVHVNGWPVRVPEGAFERDGFPRTIARFAGPIARAWAVTMRGMGVEILFWCPPYGACVEIPSSLATGSLREALPALCGLRPYRARDCARPLRDASHADLRAAGRSSEWVDVVCFRESDHASVVPELERLGCAEIAASKYKLRVRGVTNLDDVRRVRGVKIADRVRTSVLAWAPLYEASGLADALPANGHLTGRGQVLAVADTGLDTGDPDGTLHPDLRGRVRSLSSWPVNSSWDDYVAEPGSDDGPADRSSGHGTHVAGLALGSGVRSGGKYRGIAPEAELVFQAIEQHTRVVPAHAEEIPPGYYLSGRPLDLRELFREARDAGARIHINAWGDPADGGYTDDAYESDLFLSKNPDALVLFAAGNDGSDRNRDRELDRSSLYAPASAKSVVAVGAVEGPRAGVGYRGTWAGFDPRGDRFRDRRDRDDQVSGDPSHIALISSTGPTADGRIKPDVCAPGTNLPGPKSQATTATGWGLASPLPHYMYLGGTSMATAVAGGVAALLRQAWEDHLGSPPSGPALKALMILCTSTVWRRDRDLPEARHVAGFGRLDLGASLPAGAIRLVDRAHVGLQTGEVHVETFIVSEPRPFRAVLAWYDVPGERLVNDLDLSLVGPGGAVVWGNHEPGATGTPDRRNSVEVIDVPRLEPGAYRLEVVAVNVPAGAQGFALACLAAPGPRSQPGPVPAREPPTTPEPPGQRPATQLPVTLLKGIGAGYGGRLTAARTSTLAQLVALDRSAILAALRISERRAARILRRLDDLRAALDAPPAQALLDLELVRLSRSSPPPGVTAQEWQRVRECWEPLLDVFDKAAHDRLTVGDVLNGV